MPATTIDRAELVTMALKELGAISSGNPAEAEDVAEVDARVDGLIGELAVRGVVYVADVDEIPIEQSGPLAELLADVVAPTFGKPKKAPQERLLIEQRLRAMTAAETTNEPVRSTYY